MESHKSLEWLVRESASGRASAFRMLFDQTEGPLFRFIRYRVGTREDALDILQDVYVDLWFALERGKFIYSTDDEFWGFLSLIARRRVARMYRFRKPVISLDDVIDIRDSSEDRDERAIAAIDALERLEPHEQRVMDLRYFKGFKFLEIANLLGKGESAVKVEHHRAIRKLRKFLGYEKNI